MRFDMYMAALRGNIRLKDIYGLLRDLSFIVLICDFSNSFR